MKARRCKQIRLNLLLGLSIPLLLSPEFANAQTTDHQPWTVEKATTWAKSHPWYVGCNYIPSTAINQLEMWQKDTFDLPTIDRELGWAQDLGFNSVRVFLHDLLWQQDATGLLTRMGTFLDVADEHKIGVVFVLFDGVWHPFPELGKQPAPKSGIHNSGWVQSPGAKLLVDIAHHKVLKEYVTEVIKYFKADRRIHAWDLFNEPDNLNRSSYGQVELKNKGDLALVLLKKTFTWAREVHPEQPLTAGVWAGDLSKADKLSQINHFMLTESDVISFHNYKPLTEMKKDVESLKRYGRPLLCTEYMARPMESRFDPVLTYLKEKRVGAYNWGFVAGKTQTIYPWDSWQKPYANEPSLWFHDIFRRDGQPYDLSEVVFIRKTTGKPMPLK